MEISSSMWKGRLFSLKNKEVLMINNTSLLYFPINVIPNTIYRLTLEIYCKGGNGVIFCNFYGNKYYDFPHSKLVCENNWKKFDVNIITEDFSKDIPIKLRIWRGKEGTGSVFIRKVIINNSKIPIKSHSFIEDYKNGSLKVLFLRYTTKEINQMALTKAFVDNGFSVKAICFNKYMDCFGKEKLQNFIKSEALLFKPDWIHMQLQFFDKTVDPTTILQIRENLPNTIITNNTIDIREYAVPYFVNISKHIHKALISSEGQLEMYRKAGSLNVDYWQVGVNVNAFYRMPDEIRNKLYKKYKHDIVFCANNISHNFPGTNLRKKVINHLQIKYGDRFKLYGKWRDRPSNYISYLKQNEVYNASKIIISINNFNNVYKYFSKRQLIAMACGTLTLSSYIPGMEEYFENGKDLVWFKDEKECYDLLEYYLNNNEKREEIGKQGSKIVNKNHSYFCRVRELSVRLGFKEW